MKEYVNNHYMCNPYLPGKEHVPDGEPHIFGDRLYVFGSHDEIGGGNYCTGSYVGWSAPLADLSDWKYEGVILEKGLDPADPDGKACYYAPDVTQGPDGRYYLYYSIEGSMVISIAVCDSPCGKYSFYGYLQTENGHVVGSEAEDDYQFDPAVLKDDDGSYYLYSGQGLPIPWINDRKVKGAMVCKLQPDMKTMDGEQKVITSGEYNCFTENPFFEASSIRKYQGRYYFTYSPLPNTHYLCYAVSDRPDGGFTYAGALVSNADLFAGDDSRSEAMNYWGNNHGGMLELDGEYYIFYHKNSNKSPFARQGCAERIVMDANGRFAQAELTSTGLAGCIPAKGVWPAYLAWRLQRKEMYTFMPYQFLEYDDLDPYVKEEEKEEIPYLANLRDGARAGYRYLKFGGTESRIILTVRGSGSGKIRVKIGDDCCESDTVSLTGQWTDVAVLLPHEEGEKEILLTFAGDGRADLKEFAIA